MSAYDALAWYYDPIWAIPFARDVLPVLDRLLLADLPRDARLLSVCCGTGRIEAFLAARGYPVTGIDVSEGMLRVARQNAPGVEFIQADVCQMSLPATYHGAYATYHALNHLTSLGQLVTAMGNVSEALVDGGAFVFDMNMEEGYGPEQDLALVGPDTVLLRTGAYDGVAHTARLDTCLAYIRSGKARRVEQTLWERSYSEGEIRGALEQAGFDAIEAFDAVRELGMRESPGRRFFTARRSFKEK